MFSEKVHRYIFLFGTFALAFGVMMGTVPTSVPQLILLGNWLLELDFKRKWQELKTNKLFWILSSVFLIHAAGLLYSQNLGPGWDDVRTKMPLMFLPLIFFSSRTLSLKEFYTTLYFFLAGCVANTLWCLAYSFVLHHNEVVRDASRFMSHIRLGLYLNMAIVCCVYFITKSTSNIKRTGFVFLSLYFVFILFVLGLASGLANFMILFFIGLCVIIYRQRAGIKIASIIVLISFTVMVSDYFLDIKNAQLRVNKTLNNKPVRQNSAGNLYIHFDSLGQKENGNYVLMNIQLEELQREWKRLFPRDSFNYATGHNLSRYEVLVRYLASKGLNKDSAGIARLSGEDKTNIQKGIYNYRYGHWNLLEKRTYELVNEYDELLNNRHINGHSLTMRLYFWKAALHTIKKNILSGVGTGDVQQELNKAYVETNSPLQKEWYKRPHNQFLTITVALGIAGLIIFLISIIYPIAILKSYLPKLFWPFLFLALVSFILEDTLETQAGLSFYAFFNSLFVSAAWFRRNIEET